MARTSALAEVYVARTSALVEIYVALRSALVEKNALCVQACGSCPAEECNDMPLQNTNELNESY